jgi:hypothetical protein
MHGRPDHRAPAITELLDQRESSPLQAASVALAASAAPVVYVNVPAAVGGAAAFDKADVELPTDDKELAGG